MQHRQIDDSSPIEVFLPSTPCAGGGGVRGHEELPAVMSEKCFCNLSSAPLQPCSWPRLDSSSCSREWVKVKRVPSAIARSSISTSDSPGSSPSLHRQLIASRSGFSIVRYSPLLSCSLPSSKRKRTRKRPPTRGSASATSTGPASGPHQ